MLQISIIRTEGVSENTELNVFFDGKSVKALERHPEPIYAIQKGAIMRIILKNKTTKVPACSGTYKTETFPEGFQWLPLSISPQDFFHNLPDEVGIPRILVLISYDLSPVIELSEAESEDIDSLKYDSSLYLEVKKMQSKISDLEGKVKKNEVLMNEFKMLYAESCKDNEGLRKKLEDEVKNSKSLKEAVEKIKAEYEESKNNALLREEFLESLINDKKNKRNNDMGISDKENFEVFEDKKIESYREIVRKSSVEVLENVINRSSGIRKPNSAKRVLSETTCYRSNDKNTEHAIQAYMKKTKNTGKFIKDSGNVYRYGKKKIFITLKNGNLLCRVGGGFEGIDKFIAKNTENYETSPIDNLHRRAHTASSIKQREIKNLLRNNVLSENVPDIGSSSITRNKKNSCATE
ncbi:hypothetical protein SteCoe_29661 [Stentor coeruleus]|uniref:GAR domain-containing protein n=1 Tax=Stentor coeruleus TaxID=5963 RepID=A0A1R2B5N7_9CILI|nr:hypothetical protein SteCoe_29661 [Stentor coeruleus]